MRTAFTFAAMLFTVSTASATPIIIKGSSHPDLATAKGELTLSGNQLKLVLTNTSPDATISSIGYDLLATDFTSQGRRSSGIDGFLAGNVPGHGFAFSDGKLGTVPQFNGHVLDFGWITGPSFSGGNPSPGIGLTQSNTLTFIATGNFLGLTEAQIASSLFVRFQSIDPGDLSDVGRGLAAIPEPATLLLLGTGVCVAVARRRRTVR